MSNLRVREIISSLEGRFGDHGEAVYKPLGKHPSIEDMIQGIEDQIKGHTILDEIDSQTKLYLDAYNQGEISQNELEHTLNQLRRSERFVKKFKSVNGYLPKCSVKELSFNCILQ